MSLGSPLRTVGRYELVREIGRGGMAIVHLARQLDLDRFVALKELAAFYASDPGTARRFLHEARLAGALSHPNVVTVHDYVEHAGVPYISMEYVPRGSLRPLMRDLALPQAIGVLDGVLDGLTCAEARGIVHRDLKPENLMVTDEGRIKIADFGIARAVNRVATAQFRTATGTTVGTPEYMAPEQATGRPVSTATDLYSLGVIAYELLAGHVPFEDEDNPVAILVRHVNDPLPALAASAPDVDSHLCEWVMRLLAKDPLDRPPSAADAAHELEDIAIGLLGPRWRRSSALPPPDPGELSNAGNARADSAHPAGYVTFKSSGVEQVADEAAAEDASGPQVVPPPPSPLPSASEQDATSAPTLAPRLRVVRPESPPQSPSSTDDAVPKPRRIDWRWAALAVAVAAAGAAAASLRTPEEPAPAPARAQTYASKTYRITAPAGWGSPQCARGSCKEERISRTERPVYRIQFTRPTRPTAEVRVDHYALEPGESLAVMGKAVLARLNGDAKLKDRVVLSEGTMRLGSRRMWHHTYRTAGSRPQHGAVFAFRSGKTAFNLSGYSVQDAKIQQSVLQFLQRMEHPLTGK